MWLHLNEGGMGAVRHSRLLPNIEIYNPWNLYIQMLSGRNALKYVLTPVM